MNKLKGDNYEHFILDHLRKQSHFDYVWLWKDVPEHILLSEGIIKICNPSLVCKQDVGIDILAIKDNICTYIQCKNFDSPINTTDLAGYFFFKSAYGKTNTLVYYNGKICNYILSHHPNSEFINVPFVNPQINDNNIVLQNEIIPRNYQLDAYNFLKNKHRSALILPCGMGKTFVSYLVSNDYDNIIFFAPKRELVLQTGDFFKKMLPLYNNVIISLDGTRDIKKIKLKKKNVVVSTYDSCDIVNLIIHKLENLIVVIDEYHNLSKNDLSSKKNPLNQILTSNHKILFLSATPRFLDLVDIFGKDHFKYKWNDAINNKYINDFEIVLPTVEYINLEIDEFLKLFSIQNNGGHNVKIIKKIYFLLRNVIFNGNKKCILYSTSKEQAENVQSIIKWMSILFNVPINTGLIDYSLNRINRKEIISDFIKSDNIYILLNIHILDEGIDIPQCDSVFILKPNDNIENIVQRMNRCNRIMDGKQKSYIYLWSNKQKLDKIMTYINDMTNNELIKKVSICSPDLYCNKLIRDIKGIMDVKMNNINTTLSQNAGPQIVNHTNTSNSKYYCELCNFCTENRTIWYNHKKSNKHVSLQKLSDHNKHIVEPINVHNVETFNTNTHNFELLIIKQKSEIDVLKEKLRSTELILTETKNHYESRLDEAKNLLIELKNQYEKRLTETKDRIQILKSGNNLYASMI